MVEAEGKAFILEAEIQGFSVWCWPWVRWIGSFVDALTMKVMREDYPVSGFAPSEFLWLCVTRI